MSFVTNTAGMLVNEPSAFEIFIDRLNDRVTHAGVGSAKRPGYAIRNGPLRRHTPGLLSPAYALLAQEDVVENRIGLKDLLSDLIASSNLAGSRPHVDKAIEIALKKWGGGKEHFSLDEHVEALLRLRQISSELFVAAVLGDFPAADPIVNSIKDKVIRHDAIVTLVRQRILWNAFDVHRVAAMGCDASRKLTIWYMRWWLRNGTANEQIGGLIAMADAILRAYRASDRAARYGREQVSFPGGKGAILSAAEAVAKPIEQGVSEADRDVVLASMPEIETRTEALHSVLGEIKSEEGRNNQESLFEWHFGLPEVGALFVTAYRFAEDEAAMLKVILDPSAPAALFTVARRPFPSAIDPSLMTRARHLVAAYRPAVLNDLDCSPYVAGEVIAAEVSQKKAETFLTTVDKPAKPVQKKRRVARDFFDLSNHVRAI